MFEVGFTEIVLILGLALLVLGPEKLPGLAQKVGRWTGRARAMARQLRTQLEHEVTMEDLAKSRPMHAPPAEAPTATTDSTASIDTSATEVDEAARGAEPALDLETIGSGVEPSSEQSTPDTVEAATKAPQ